jgi:hypothetical protein
MILSRMALVTATLGALARYAPADPWAGDANPNTTDPAPANADDPQNQMQPPADMQYQPQQDQPKQDQPQQAEPQSAGDKQMPAQANDQSRSSKIDAVQAHVAVVDGEANMIRTLAAAMPAGGSDRARADQAVNALDNELKQTRQQASELEKVQAADFSARVSQMDDQLKKLDAASADAWKQVSDSLHTRAAT